MKYHNFKFSEFACPCCGLNKTRREFIQSLDKARDIAKIPFVINSGYRCHVHNALMKNGVTSSSHTLGLGADIVCLTNVARAKIVQALFAVGFTRIGIYPHHIHVDGDSSKPSPRMWVEDYS